MLQFGGRRLMACVVSVWGLWSGTAHACAKGAAWSASDLSSLPDCVVVELPPGFDPVTMTNDCVGDIQFVVMDGEDAGLTVGIAPGEVWPYLPPKVNELDAEARMTWEMASADTALPASGEVVVAYDGWDCPPGACNSMAGSFPGGIGPALLGVGLLGLRRRRRAPTT